MTERCLTALIGLLTGGGAVLAQPPAPTSVDRLALRGAIACTWTLSSSPHQYEVFETLRQFFPHHQMGDTVSDAERDGVIERLKEWRLTDFEERMLSSCIKQEGERRLLISR